MKTMKNVLSIIRSQIFKREDKKQLEAHLTADAFTIFNLYNHC